VSDPENGFAQDDKLQELGRRYLQRTAEEVHGLQQSLATAHADPGKLTAELVQTVHRIRGSGAMLGFQRITAATRELDEFLRQRNAGALSEAELAYVRAQLLSLEQIVQAGMHSPQEFF
jgi:HPt (histidine-containing phosphotransfer) domain-containing protein